MQSLVTRALNAVKYEVKSVSVNVVELAVTCVRADTQVLCAFLQSSAALTTELV